MPGREIVKWIHTLEIAIMQEDFISQIIHIFRQMCGVVSPWKGIRAYLQPSMDKV